MNTAILRATPVALILMLVIQLTRRGRRRQGAPQAKQLSGPAGAAPAVQSVQPARLRDTSLRLNPSDLSTDAWLGLFDLSLSKPGGIALSRAVRQVQSANPANPRYAIPDLISVRRARASDTVGTAGGTFHPA